MSQFFVSRELKSDTNGNAHAPALALAAGMLLAALSSAPTFAAGTDVSTDEIYSDGVTLTTFDGMPLDIDGDGEVDLAIASNQGTAASRSRYYPGNGDGTFDLPVLLTAGASSEMVAGDLNGDMDLDLIQARRDLTNLLYLGDGAGGLAAPTDIGADTRRHLSIALGDLDNDGDLDVVIGSGHPLGQNGNPLETNRFCLSDFVQLATHTYTCDDITADADDTRGIALADMDGDGNLDVIVGNDETTPGSNRVYLNLFVSTVTPVSFAPGIDFGDPDDQTSKILIGDLNDDGLPDIVTVNTISTASQPGNGVNRFFINETNGGVFALSAATDVAADANRSSGGVLADFDGDGDLDLATANLVAQAPGESGLNRLYLNQFEETGAVGFGPGIDISTDDHQSREVAAADLNNDGLIDLVVGNQNNVPGVKDRVYLNSGNPADPFGDGPFFTSTPVTDANEGVAYTYDVTASDPDVGDTLTIEAVTALPAWLTLTDNADRTATLTGTPGAADVGPHDISLEVSDGTATETQDFTITVIAAPGGNNPPTFTSTPVTDANEGVAYTYDITASDPDVGDTLTIEAVTALPAWLTLTDNADRTATLAGTPGAADVGPHDISLEVSDGTASEVQDFTITVVAAPGGNNPPTFTSTPVTDATDGAAYAYDVTTSDIDAGDTLSIEAATALPAWLTLTDNGDGTAALAGTPDAGDVGDHDISLEVSDGTASAVQDFTITVAAAGGNSAPTFTSTPVVDATEGTTYTYDVTASDADAGDALEVTAPTLPAWLMLADNGDGTATLTGTAAAGDVGDHDVTLEVSDGTDTAAQSFTITVVAAGPPPTFPPPTFGGGGGSLGFLTLLALGSFGAARLRRRRT